VERAVCGRRRCSGGHLERVSRDVGAEAVGYEKRDMGELSFEALNGRRESRNGDEGLPHLEVTVINDGGSVSRMRRKRRYERSPELQRKRALGYPRQGRQNHVAEQDASGG